MWKFDGTSDAVFYSEKAQETIKMKSAIAIALLCISGLVASHEDDGSWKGEGLAESQYNEHQSESYYGDEYGNGYYGNTHYGGAYGYNAAPLGHDGRVVDTPEVAHAKAAHFAAVNAASHGASAQTYGAWTGYGSGYESGYGAAHIELTHDGKYLKDTPEVAQAKAAHFAAHANAAHGVHGAPLAYGSYSGAYAPSHVELTPDGKYLKDTPEVAHARAQHLAAKAAASHSNSYYGHNDEYSHNYNNHW